MRSNYHRPSAQTQQPALGSANRIDSKKEFYDPDLLTTEEIHLLGLLANAKPGLPETGAHLSTADEVLLRAVIENVEKREGYIYDHSSGKMIAGGEAVAGLYGYTHEEILSLAQGWFSVVHPEDAGKVAEMMDMLVSARCEVACVQMRVERKDGRWEWIQHDWRALTRDQNGTLRRAVGLVQVITPMAAATQALSNEACLSALCRILVDEWVEGLFILDSAWQMVYANHGALDRLGYTQEDLFGRPFDTVVTCDGGRRRLPSVSKPDQKLVVRGVQTRHDKSTYPVEVTFRRLHGERILVTTRDITEQLATEEMTRRQAAYYKGLFENNPSGVAVFDSTFEVTEVNPALRKMLGYTEKQLCLKNLSDLMDRPSRVELETWRQMGVGLDGKLSTEADITLRRRDGRLFHSHAAVTLMADDSKSGFQGIIMLTDISARLMAEQELARQFHLNDILVRESAAMIGMIDREGRVIKVNPAVEAASGYVSEELVGKLMWECGLVDEEEMPRARARLQMLVEGEPRVTAMSRTRTKNGELRILQVHNTATRNANGEVENFIITAIDMTEQQRLQHHLMEAVEAEQARIGHDLHDGVGQILTGIGAMTEVLQSKLNGTQADEAGRIFELVHQAIHQVRQLSRNMSPAAVQHRDLSASLLLLADTVRTSLRRQCQTALDPTVQVIDPTLSAHLFRISQEAVNNAIRHGNPEMVTISLRRGDLGVGVLEIFNDGATFDCKPGSASEGIGMRVMNYRASMIHAELSVTCPPTGGVSVICKFPLPMGSKKSPQNKNKRNTPP